MLYNIYCDESCHLENDHQKAMALGGIWCESTTVNQHFKSIRSIKIKHGLKSDFEIKWTKISPAKTEFYLELIAYFFENKDLYFRGLVIPNKAELSHEKFNQTHDEWYYKMYFSMLKTILSPHDTYNIYIDIKDTAGGKKVAGLHDVLCNNLYDFDKQIIKKIQIVESHHIELMQLTDIFIGALSYLFRELSGNTGKEACIKKIQELSGYSLQKNTLLREEKLNLFIWEPNA